MRILVFLSVFVFSGCSDATENKPIIENTETCDIFFNMTGPCVYKNVVASIDVEKVAFDEKLLQTLEIVRQSQKFSLNIAKNTSMLDGDRGYISFADINFDTIPDISITTSFGLANLYLDYWVFDNIKKQYFYLGNFPRFKLNNKDRSLSNTLKINAAKYENNIYKWQGLNLIKQ